MYKIGLGSGSSSSYRGWFLGLVWSRNSELAQELNSKLAQKPKPENTNPNTTELMWCDGHETNNHDLIVGELFSNPDHFSILLIWLSVSYGDTWPSQNWEGSSYYMKSHISSSISY